MNRLQVRVLAYCRGRAPAAAFAIWVALGQLCAWWLERNQCLALASVCALLLVVTRSGYRGLLAGALVGVVSCYSRLAQEPAHAQPAGGDAVALVRVEDAGRRGTVGRVAFRVRDVLRESRPLMYLRAVELPWRNAARVEQGDLIWVRGEEAPVYRTASPWSWGSYLWRQGIDLEFKARYLSKPVERPGAGPLVTAREWLRRRTGEMLGERRGAALFLSMALGYRDVLSEQVEEGLGELGLSHLLVVSGYQVTMVFGIACAPLAWGVGIISGARWARQAVAALALSVVAVYVAFIGAEASAVRAFVAAAFVCAEALIESGRRFSQRWGAALLALELLWPWAALEIGVQLTFAALAGIGLGRCLGRNSGVKTFLWTQCSVWAFTGVIVAAWSGKVAWLGILLNVVIAPFWSAWNCVAGLLAFVVASAGVPGGAQLFTLVAWVNEALADVALWVREVLGTRSELSLTARLGAVAGYCLASIALCLLGRKRSREMEVIALAR